MSTRLPIDAAVVGYWGFDEANPADVAVGEAGAGRNLVVYNAPSVMPARLGNGRQFDGTNTYARPADSTPYRTSINTIIVWFILDSVNQAGDLLRPILTVEGPGAGVDDDTAHGLYVNSAGAIVYRYTDSSRRVIQAVSPASTIRTNRYYSLAVVREVVAPTLLDPIGGVNVILYINNMAVTWATTTIDGLPAPNPNVLPSPATPGVNTILTVGGAAKSASRWHGVLDELSLHSSPRPKQPYLDAAYYRLTLAATFSRLTMQGSIKVLAAVEMGGGTRWWCYERDQSIYVIRENSLGLFSAEVQLTPGRDRPDTAPSPGGVERPRLAYDAATDTLVVAFLAVGRVYKITATSGDAPSPQIMPFTADVSNAIKAIDSVDLLRAGAGEQQHYRWATPGEIQFDALPATVAFLHTPSFGVEVLGSNPYGYAVLREVGGSSTFVGYARGTQQTDRALYQSPNYWFVPVATRVHGAAYRAYPLTVSGAIIGQPEGNAVTDWVDQVAQNTGAPQVWDPNAFYVNKDGSAFIDAGDFSAGEGRALQNYVVSTLYPLKQLVSDTMIGGSGEPLDLDRRVVISTTPLKQLLREDMQAGAGDATWLTMTLGDRRVQL